MRSGADTHSNVCLTSDRSGVGGTADKGVNHD
jgi:hypothetical protein